jgi:hypothetical protein
MRWQRLPRWGFVTGLVVLIAMTCSARPAAAQVQGPPPQPDFLFGRPGGSLAVRGGWVFARAGSDLFDFVQRELTIDEGDFNTAAFATDVGIALSSRADAVIGLDYSQASVASEYREFVDNNRLPIEQTTSLKALNLTGSIRFALAPRGREISRLAWVPRTVVPYVGAGGGMIWYQFRQAGDFIDALDPSLAVFSDTFTADGWTPSAHVLGGVDVKVFRRLYLTVDGRYVWAAGDLGSDFENFDPIDLAGFRFGVGINVVF